MREFWTSVLATASMLCMATPGEAAVLITGSLNFAGQNVNYFDPSNGGVPPGFGNDSGTTVPVGPGVEFGYRDSINFDTANFSSSGLVLQDISNFGSAQATYSFTTDAASYFADARLTSNSLGGSFLINGDTLTYDAPGFITPGTYSADFTFGENVSAVPEPSTWVMMLLGFGGLGFLAYGKARDGSAMMTA